MNNAEVLVKFRGDTSDLDEQIKNSGSSLKNLGGIASSAFKVATTAVAGVTVAVGALVKSSVDAYAEFEQLEGGLVSLFGEGSKEMESIMKNSEDAWKNLTMSQNDYLTAFEGAYPLVNAGMGENADSIEYTNKMLQISSDLYNTYGGSVEQYQNAINWALKGTYSYLDNLNLGIKGTQEGFIEAANSSGVLSRNIKDVSELTTNEIIDVIQHYSEQYGVWGKTAEEAGTTIIGSLNMTKSAWNNFMAGLAKGDADIDTLIDNLMNAVTTFGNNIVPVIMRALKGITKALPKLAKIISKELPDVVNDIIPPLIESVSVLLNALVNALPGLITTIIPLLIQAIMSLIESLAQALPQIIQALITGIITVMNSLAQQMPTLIPVVVKAIIDGILTILDNIDLIIDAGIQLIFGIIDGIMEAIPILTDKIPEIIDKLIMAITNNLPKMIEAGIMVQLKLGEGLIKAIPQLVSNIPQIIMSLVKGFVNMLGKFKDIGVKMIKGLWDGIKSAKDWILGKIRGFCGGIVDGIKGFFGIHSPSKLLAEEIGQYLPKGIAVGIDANTDSVFKSMRNMENELSSSFGLSPNLSNSSAFRYNASAPITNVYVNSTTDPLGQTVSNIKTFSGGAKNDYNYGMGV